MPLSAVLGPYLGSREELLLQRENPLKYWERADVVALDDARLGSPAKGPRWAHYGYDPSLADPKGSISHSEEAKRIVANLDSHGTWATKDPRMCLLAAEWLPLLSSPICVMVEREVSEWAWSIARGCGITEE